jgi:DNA-binding response OmpR family regulator
VIAITGIGEEDAQPRMMEAGADAFFSKPLNFDALIAKTKELMEARKDLEKKDGN